ncbi:hypothetical protein TNIN_54121 [Trichonephila inaurata madagascariensis]|uniref:IS110 family transposase n=3 Tax=cellular organisms TaxID=131567 RepID=A0A8X7CU63_9ARAC|nr:hypothetical protein TNIN_54121 [Trichonephila inaurata madagascariensis]
MQVNAVLGVDISKQKFDACLLIGSKERHKVFHNNQEGFEKLVAWCNNHGAKLIHLCLEATGCYSEDIVIFMYDLGNNVSVVNPAQTKAFGKSELLRNKTDKSDAAMIARFCIANKPNLWKPVPTEVRRLRELYRCLQALKDDKLQQMNRLENENMYISCKQAILEVIAVIETQITALEKEINEHINNYHHLKNMMENLKTVKGVGHLTAIAVIAEMPSVDNFDHARQFTAFAGLNPQHYQSGSSVLMKERLKGIEEEKKKVVDQKAVEKGMNLIINSIKSLYSSVKSNLEQLDWRTKRGIIKALIEQINIGRDQVEVAFRIEEPA